VPEIHFFRIDYASREETLQEECLAQPLASIKQQHLPTGPVALPSAVEGGKLERSVI